MLFKKKTIAPLLDELERLGFYKYTSPDQVEKVKAESIKTGYLFGEMTGRDYIADSENLAEGGVKTFLNSLAPFLKDQDVTFNTIEEDFNVEGSYTVIVEGESFVMYTEDELSTGNFWELTTRRALSLVNKFLKNAGSSERMYFLYGGNDTQAVFLTPDMFKIISESSLIQSKDNPSSVD
ncbi:MAG TPA: hypothetical protein VFC63_07065 [Blastocatellia bacterium]|nr:hypothetical protein [Blastocatellia bacterium]